MIKYLISAVTVMLMCGCTINEPEVYLYSFFQNNGEDGLHLAWSEDGLNWTALNNNESFLTPSV